MRAVGTARMPVWMRHTGGSDGPVTALAEQYRPDRQLCWFVISRCW